MRRLLYHAVFVLRVCWRRQLACFDSFHSRNATATASCSLCAASLLGICSDSPIAQRKQKSHRACQFWKRSRALAALLVSLRNSTGIDRFECYQIWHGNTVLGVGFGVDWVGNNPEYVSKLFSVCGASSTCPFPGKCTFPDCWTLHLFLQKVSFHQQIDFFAHISKGDPLNSVHMDHTDHLGFR